MNLLSKAKIIAAKDIVSELVSVPEWGGDVYVRGMTGDERDAFESSLIQDKEVNLQHVRAKLCAKTMCDDKGERLFQDADMPALAKKSAAGLQRVFIVAQKLSGIRADDVKDMVQSLKTDPFTDSPSV